jgi:hypothetical protein
MGDQNNALWALEQLLKRLDVGEIHAGKDINFLTIRSVN